MWTPEQLGKTRRGSGPVRFMCYPTALENVTVKVEGEDPEEVCAVANKIEEQLGAKN